MALPDIADVGVVASFERWGFPYHGLAVGGVVPISNHVISQPSGGDTYVQQFSNAPEPSMTPDEIAAEAALGRTWLDYAVLAGSGQQIYGAKNLGPRAWIYGASDGTRWLVKLTSAGTITGNSQTFTFSVKRFGEFNGTAESYTRSVVVADIGQASPAAAFHSDIEGGAGGYDCTVGTYELYLEDVKPNGSHAVISLRSLCPQTLLNWTPSWWAGEKVSMGFLSVTLTDTIDGPSVAVSVLHDRADAMGTVDTVTNGYESTNRIIAVWFDEDGDPLPVKLGLSFPVNLVEATIPCPGMGGTSSSAEHVWSFSWGAQSASFTASMTASTSGTCTLEDVAGGTAYVTMVDATYSYNLEGLFSATATWTVETNYASVAFTGVNVMRWVDGSFLSDATPANVYHGCGLFRIHPSGGGTYTGDEFMWAIKRISNKYFGLLAMKFPAGTVYQTSSYSAWAQTKDMVWVGGFSLSGYDGHRAALGVLANVVPTGSVQPITNLPHLRPDGTPVCYV